MQRISLKKGMGLVEVLVGVFVFSVILGALIYASNLYLSGAGDSLQSAQAAYFGEEGVEAMRTIRDAAWTNVTALSTSTTYYLVFDYSSSTNYAWKATTTATTTDSMTRKINLATVMRDSNGRIVSSGGTVDANTRKVTVSVSWPYKATTTVKTIATYLTNIIGN